MELIENPGSAPCWVTVRKATCLMTAIPWVASGVCGKRDGPRKRRYRLCGRAGR